MNEAPDVSPVMLDMFKALATQNPGYAIAYALLELARQVHDLGQTLAGAAGDIAMDYVTPVER